MCSRTCECCGRVFFSKSKLRKYCSKVCAKDMAQRKRDEYGQLCWTCRKACGGCDWTRCFKPVEGWNAKQTVIKNSNGDIQSYRIKECPEFIKI